MKMRVSSFWFLVHVEQSRKAVLRKAASDEVSMKCHAGYGAGFKNAAGREKGLGYRSKLAGFAWSSETRFGSCLPSDPAEIKHKEAPADRK